MEAQYYGANCIKINTKNASIVVDDNLQELGLKSVVKDNDVVLYTTGKNENVKGKPKLIIDQPGEYEVSQVSINGVAARAHIDEEGQENAIIYKINLEDLRVAVCGHIYPELSEAQLEQIGTVDILFIPVGGAGYTLDSVGALTIIKKIEPRIVIPTHYQDSKINYPVAQQSLDDAIKQLSIDVAEKTDKLKIKSSDVPENLQIIILERQ